MTSERKLGRIEASDGGMKRERERDGERKRGREPERGSRIMMFSACACVGVCMRAKEGR